jgi:flagellar basal body-associated protein FliL
MGIFTKAKPRKKSSFKIQVLIPILAIFIISVLVISFISYRLLNSAIKTQTETYTQIADELNLSPNTIKTYRTSLYLKLGINSRRVDLCIKVDFFNKF